MKTLTSLAFSAALTLAGLAPAQDWTSWRGPNGDGSAPNADVPLEWSDTKNVAWKTPIPGEGYSTPVFTDDYIILTTSIDTGEKPRVGSQNVYTFHVIALDRETGAIAWNTMVKEEVPHAGTHATNVQASCSAAIDGDRIYANFGSRGIFCLDMLGEVQWERDLGNMNIVLNFGEGASAAVADGVVVVPWDHQGESVYYGLDAATGETRWRNARPREASNWSTPVVTVVGGSKQVVAAGWRNTFGYDLQTGREIWKGPGLTRNTIPVPIIKDGIAYMTAGFQGNEMLAIDLTKARGAFGKDSDAVLWSYGRVTPYVPSPTIVGDDIYFLRSYNAAISSVNINTGEPNYRAKRIPEVGNVYASLMSIGNEHILVACREGKTAIVKAGDDFELVRINELSEGINATPVAIGNRLYIRTTGHLYCFSKEGA
ncbi:MAG: PQQ-binding-like beta-propeller repeat protein [Planctomycetota bacterium]